jgi:hypothetical protein
MSKARYKIVITETVMETTNEKSWERLVSDDEASNLGVSARGWTEPREVEKEVCREIFMQNTDELDIVSVIATINGI